MAWMTYFAFSAVQLGRSSTGPVSLKAVVPKRDAAVVIATNKSPFTIENLKVMVQNQLV
jgi:hypothetical protein